jgi:hypothetical protein
MSDIKLEIIGKNPKLYDQFFTLPYIAEKCVNILNNLLENNNNSFDLVMRI